MHLGNTFNIFTLNPMALVLLPSSIVELLEYFNLNNILFTSYEQNVIYIFLLSISIYINLYIKIYRLHKMYNWFTFSRGKY